MTTTILYGNGVNLLRGGKTWTGILKEISQSGYLPPIKDNTLLYEYIMLPKDQKTYLVLRDCFGRQLIDVEGKQFRVCEITEEYLKEKLCKKLLAEPSWFYDELVKMNADNYLTTNYKTYLNQKYEDKHIVEFKDDSSKESILLYNHEYTIKNGKKTCFWNIHGSVNTPSTILLGLHEYCKYVVAINDIIHKDSESWVNLFFNTNVHIIGFGLGYEETDLWYILTTRKRRMKEKGDVNNEIFFYAIKDSSYDIAKNKLLEAAGVKVIDIDFSWGDNEYDAAYSQICNEFNILRQNE